MQRKTFQIYLPLILAGAVAAGMFLGSLLQRASPAQNLLPVRSRSDGYAKIRHVLKYIENEYVDTVSNDELVEDALVKLLAGLDPHSNYIPASELQAMKESLEGNFEGIGIEFNIQSDTIVVVAPISGGPSDLLGILPGDRIVEIEGRNVASADITNQDVMDKLRGKGGTKVSVRIFRRGTKDIIAYTITRGEIPITSVDVAFMAGPATGYIKLSRFSRHSYEEYMEAFGRLKAQGMEKLILDLRGNPGGYLDVATVLADEFLEKGRMIVYTEGRARPRTPYYATARGSFEGKDIAVLIDEGSASASEIIAGALQDNDRGIIIGRRSFGKGLVQEESVFPDGSALRLTIARYYTPSGRCIQRPYGNGADAYYSELYDRVVHPDSDTTDVNTDSLKYTTAGGRTVYGGGGITPDIVVVPDTTGYSSFLNRLLGSGLIGRFAFTYADGNREQLKNSYTAAYYNASFRIGDVTMQEFLRFAAGHGVERDDDGLKTSGELIALRLKAEIGRIIWRNDSFYPILLERDNIYRKALEALTKKGT